MLKKLFLIAVIILVAGVFSPSISYAQLEYSHAFENGVGYCPGEPQFDDWLTFRASLPTSGIASITVSGSRDTIGRTCGDPAIAQQIADAMRTRTDLFVTCGGNDWAVDNECQALGCTAGQTDNDLSLSASGNDNCACSADNYTLRPGIGNDNWGGIDDNACDAATQTMTVSVRLLTTDVPTLSQWGLIAMSGILGIVGFMVIRRRNVTA